MTLEQIKQVAKEYKACKLADDIETWQDAADTLFLPQGQEFFEKTGFPDGKAIKSASKEVDGFYANRSFRLGNPPNLCVCGKGYHSVSYDGVPSEVPTIILRETDINIILNNYAIVKVVTFGECNVFVEGDGTGIVL